MVLIVHYKYLILVQTLLFYWGKRNLSFQGSIIKYSEPNFFNTSNLLLYNSGDENNNNVLCIKNNGKIGIKNINPNYNLDISFKY